MSEMRYGVGCAREAVRRLAPALELVTPPTVPLLTLHEARTHLRVEIDPEATHPDDEFIKGLVAAATGELDGPGAWLGRALRPQTWKLTLNGWWSGVLDLPLPPLQSVDSVSCAGEDGEHVDVDPALYTVGAGNRAPFRGVRLAPGKQWPDLPAYPVGGSEGCVAVTFTAGYPVPPAPPQGQEPPLPNPELALIQAYARLRIGRWYEHREDLVAGTTFGEMPGAASSLNGVRADYFEFIR